MIKKVKKYYWFFLVTFFSLKQSVFAYENGKYIADLSDNRVGAEDVSASCRDVIPSSVIERIKTFWDIIVVLGPLVFIVMSLVDLAKVITSSEDGELKKVFKRIIRRLIALIILILLPLIVNFILSLINSRGNLGVEGCI